MEENRERRKTLESMGKNESERPNFIHTREN